MCWAIDYRFEALEDGRYPASLEGWDRVLFPRVAFSEVPPPWALVRTLDLNALTDFDTERFFEFTGYKLQAPKLYHIGMSNEHILELAQWPHTERLTRLVVPHEIADEMTPLLFMLVPHTEAEIIVADPIPDHFAWAPNNPRYTTVD